MFVCNVPVCVMSCVSMLLTGCDRYPEQVVNESEEKVDSDSPHCFFRKLDAGHDVQQVILSEKFKKL